MAQDKSIPSVLFVMGVPRSGTTAIAHLLNAHPEICIGIERYKYRFMGRKFISGDEFSKARFFNFIQEDTNILPREGNSWMRIYREMEEKWDNARIVGDKIPNLFKRIDKIKKIFPNGSYIYMLRDPRRVASSWNVRAKNARDSWPERNDYAKAVDSWNSANMIARKMLEDGVRLSVVPFEEFFSAEKSQFERLIEFLGVSYRDEFVKEYDEKCKQYFNIKSKSIELTKDEEIYVDRHADIKVARQLMARGVQA